MKLYSFHQSSSAYRVRIALALKGLAPEMDYINLTKGEQKSADYAAVNPQMAVPTLLEGEHALVQSLAIMEYLEEAHPTPAILPKDIFARAHVRALSQLVACDISPLGNLKVRKYLEGNLNQPKETVENWLRYWIVEGLKNFEATLAQHKTAGDFCYGNTPTMADCCLMPQIFNANRWKCDLSPFPIINRIVANCEAHPAFITAHPKNQKDAT